MKFLIAGSLMALLFSVPQKAISQNGTLVNLTAGAVNMQALSIVRTLHFPGIVQLRGSVEIITKIGVNDAPASLMIMVLRADEADYHEDTGEIEARGDVRMNYRDDPSGTKAGNVRIKLEKIDFKVATVVCTRRHPPFGEGGGRDVSTCSLSFASKRARR